MRKELEGNVYYLQHSRQRVPFSFSSLFTSFTIITSIYISQEIFSSSTPFSFHFIYSGTENSMNTESVLLKSLNSV